QNLCVLMLGAGFTSGMKNKLGAQPPLGSKLAEILWREMKYDGGPPHGFGLSRVFQLFESAGKPSSVLRRILEDNLLMDQIPDRYDVIAQPFWHRIYTTNIDDSLDIIYRR